MENKRVFVTFAILLLAFVSAKKKGMLEIVIMEKPENCQQTAENGDMVAVHYVGTLESGAIFDSSQDPISFVLGKNTVIKGWEQGIKGMCLGEKRKLIVPSHLGYGQQSKPSIPPDSTLFFEVELMDITKPSTFDALSQSLVFIVVPGVILIILIYFWQKANFSSKQQTTRKQRKKKK